jgi:TonB family protein
MIRSIVIAIVFVLTQFTTSEAQLQRIEGQAFEPVQVLQVVDPVYPRASVACGVVILKVTVSAAGEVESTKVIRGIPSLTQAAERAVKQWKFRPAKLDGSPVRSFLVVSFAFSTSSAEGDRWRSQPLPSGPSNFQPIRVLSAVEAPYPGLSVAAAISPASVILQVDVDESGAVDRIKVLHGVASLTESAERVISEWRFQPATMNNRPVSSTMIASFSFRNPPTMW